MATSPGSSLHLLKSYQRKAPETPVTQLRLKQAYTMNGWRGSLLAAEAK